jgi:U3 small nucleolar RNA-associated protein 10
MYRDGEHSASTSATLKRRIQALILFASTSLTTSASDKETDVPGGGSTTDLIIHLVDLTTLQIGQAPESDLAAIVAAAQTAIERVMKVISAGEFLSGVLVMLKSEESRVSILLTGRVPADTDDASQIKAGALVVISERVPLIHEKVRQEHRATMIEIVDLVRDIIVRQSAGTLVESALAALNAIASTCCAGEESAVLATLPHAIKVVRSRTSAPAAVAVLPSYM